MNSSDIRESFLAFFESKGHQRMASSSLIPVGDPTLLLTTAGMVQFKPYFAGESEPPNRRLTSSQKAFRTVDIDEVGDATHLTLFEMLGNFSIGDYFKQGAVELALECFAGVYGLPKEQFAATVHDSDEEAYGLWMDVGIPTERIFKFGDEDNWWGPASLEGPCGPCSELHYDFGVDKGCLQPDCGPNCVNTEPETGKPCQRYVELWNLVFMQYYHHLDGKRTPLPAPSVDTGMGLERLAIVMQGASDIYGTDLFAPLLETVGRLTGKTYGADAEDDYAMRVVSEHGRSAAFLIADGVVPANEGRGYVLRRVVRRAIRHARRLGLEDAFLGEVAATVTGTMGEAYPELRNHSEFVQTVLKLEEERFQQVFWRGDSVLRGMIEYRIDAAGAIPDVIGFAEGQRPGSDSAAAILEQHGFVGYYPDVGPEEQLGNELAATPASEIYFNALEAFEEERDTDAREHLESLQKWSNELTGSEVFFLHDTFGFPMEVTREIAAERGIAVDDAGFEREMEAQRERGRAGARFGGDRAKIRVYEGLGVGATSFLGYETVTASSVVVGLLSQGEDVSEIEEGVEAEVVLVETPFYPEGGGQVGDAGVIAGSEGRVDVNDTQTVMPGLIVHFGVVSNGTLSVGDSVDAKVDPVRREDVARNHTATHMLHAALRQVLGTHVRQHGSLVAADRLRFDFSHVQAVTQEEIEQVQWLVNERIRQDAGVQKSEDTYASAIRRGALAFFGDKYDERVRLVEIANGEIFSFEVCGGTHVGRTGELGAVYVLGESSVGAGMRRIEAVSGRAAERLVRQRFLREEGVAAKLQTTLPELDGRVQSLLDEVADLRRKNEELERRASLGSAESLLERKQDVGGVSVLSVRVEAANSDAIREMGDWLRDKMGSGVVVLGSVVDGRPVLIAMVTQDLVQKGLDASAIAKGAAKAIGGGGGGKADVAQAGGRHADKLDEALASVPELVASAAAGPADQALKEGGAGD